MASGVFPATIVLALGSVLPMRATVTDTLKSSAVSRTLTDPDGAPQRVSNSLAGDRIVEALMNLQSVVGPTSHDIAPARVRLLPGAP